jgi:hypothetical protein
VRRFQVQFQVCLGQISELDLRAALTGFGCEQLRAVQSELELPAIS